MDTSPHLRHSTFVGLREIGIPRGREGTLGHAGDEAAGRPFAQELESCAHEAALVALAFEVFCDLGHSYVPVVDLEQELHQCLLPRVAALETGRFDDALVVDVAQAEFVQPAYRKSSASGIRV